MLLKRFCFLFCCERALVRMPGWGKAGRREPCSAVGIHYFISRLKRLLLNTHTPPPLPPRKQPNMWQCGSNTNTYTLTGIKSTLRYVPHSCSQARRLILTFHAKNLRA